MGMFDRQPKGGAAPPKAGKATALPCSFPQFPISECASRQTAVTLFSLDLAAYHKAMRISVACPSVSLSLVSTHSTD